MHMINLILNVNKGHASTFRLERKTVNCKLHFQNKSAGEIKNILLFLISSYTKIPFEVSYSVSSLFQFEKTQVLSVFAAM